MLVLILFDVIKHKTTERGQFGPSVTGETGVGEYFHDCSDDERLRQTQVFTAALLPLWVEIALISGIIVFYCLVGDVSASLMRSITNINSATI